ncbi:hypothetical protein ACSFBX_20650 [Variovorax sp. RB2P76]|uniref:hypothetical protein n=1 Tax=Variovorax sp. RB2P76 TaxID=3443736 RepID=UPI003F47A958
MQLLERLGSAEMPMIIDDHEDIEKCDLLRAAKLIAADIPPFMHNQGRTTYSGQATVMWVTPRGEAALKMRACAQLNSAQRSPDLVASDAL